MTRPIGISVDLEVGAGYVRYRPDDDPDGRPPRNVRFHEDVVADLDRSGNLLGIELLSFDQPALEAAKEFATQNGYAFPRDLAGLLP